MLNIPGIMTVNYQCKDKEGNIGTFLTDEYGNQFAETFVDACALFNSHAYKFCNSHGIEVRK